MQLCSLLWLPLTSPKPSCIYSRGSEYPATPAAVYRGDTKKRIISDCTVVRKIPSGDRVDRHLFW